MTVTQVNYINIGLMVVSAAVAFAVPFELFIFAYAVLGPLHYLTEISWLHDRGYFTSGKFDYLVLLVPCVPVLIALTSGQPAGDELGAVLTWFVFGSALGMVVLNRAAHKLSLGIALVVSGLLLADAPRFLTVFTLLLPTIIHVFVFTGAFIIFGALKSRSGSGYLSFAVYVLCPLTFIWFRPAAGDYRISEYVRGSASAFEPLTMALASMFGLGRSWDEIVAVMRLIAYAYTYHYLNWFSKTKIIRWHEISGGRMGAILAAWVIALGTYAIDYQFGLLTLFLLSFAHVLLEFPLNHRSFIGIAAELRERAAGS